MHSSLTDDIDLKSGRGLKIALIGTRWNIDVVEPMMMAARNRLIELRVRYSAIDTVSVPGAYELPLAAKKLALSRKYDGILAFGCVIRGETAHFDYVAGEAARGLTQASLESGIPIMFGVLTTENREQALERALPERKNKGSEIAEDAVSYIRTLNAIEAA